MVNRYQETRTPGYYCGTMEDTDAADDRATVLVVDDEPDAADLYAEYLPDYRVLTAYSGPEALEQISPEVDVVLLDRMMPETHGDEVLRRIRDRDLDCRVVFVTAVTPDIEVVDLPFDDYLVKPVSEETVRDAVERMLKRNTYDEQIHEIVTLASRMATLESKMDISELEASARYTAMENRLRELRDGNPFEDSDEELYEELTAEKVRLLLE